MLKLRTSWVTPQGGWRFPRFVDRPIADPNNLIRGGDLPDLIRRVTEFRVANGMDIGDLPALVEDFMCRVSNADCVPLAPRKPGRKARGGDVARFLYAMTLWATKGGFVPQEEAEERAETCANCDRNQEIDDSKICEGCFGFASRVLAIIGNRKTRVDSALKFCNECGCANSIQAFVPMEILARVHRLEDFPDHCWKKKWVEAQKKVDDPT